MVFFSFSRVAPVCVIALTVVLALAAGPATSPPTLDRALEEVDSLRSHRQFDAALARLDSLVQKHPDDVAVQWRRALLLTDLGKATDDEDRAISLYRDAERQAKRALRTDSTSAWAHLTMALAAGRLTLHVGRSDRVEQSRAVKRHADRAIALDSTLAGAYHLRARWHREVADLGFFTRALVKALYGGLPDASYEQAIRDFKRAIELESKPYNHLELAKTYLALDREEDARDQLRIALKLSGSPFDAVHKRKARALAAELQ